MDGMDSEQLFLPNISVSSGMNQGSQLLLCLNPGIWTGQDPSVISIFPDRWGKCIDTMPLIFKVAQPHTVLIKGRQPF